MHIYYVITTVQKAINIGRLHILEVALNSLTQVKSKHRTSVKIWIAIKLILLVLSFLSLFQHPDQMALFFVFLVLLMYNLKSRSETITINDDGIIIRNYFTFDKKTYTFDDLDDIVKVQNEMDNLDGMSLYLRKGDKIFGKIRALNYQNVEEMVTEIRSRKSRVVI